MKKTILLITVLLGTSFLWGQTKVLSGIITDKKSGEPLAFATVKADTGAGTMTDTEGKFLIQSKKIFSSITVSYVGYYSKEVPVKNSFIKIEMTPSVEKLNEVVITAKKSPALILMEKVVAFNSYNKIVVTANPDSIQPTIDSVFVKKNGKKTFVELDSTNYDFYEEIKDKHLYIAEKISEIKFKRGKKRKVQKSSLKEEKSEKKLF